MAQNEVIFGLTPIRLAVWQSVTELIRQRPSLEEIADHAGCSTATTGKALMWLRDQQGAISWTNKRRSYALKVKAPVRKSA
jgi:uncharacterized protein YerC